MSKNPKSFIVGAVLVACALGAWVLWEHRGGELCLTRPRGLLASVDDVRQQGLDSKGIVMLPAGRYRYTGTTGTKDYLFYHVDEGESLRGYVLHTDGVRPCTDTK